MDLPRMRERGGTRGGLEQFRWDEVKGQNIKDREMYKKGMILYLGQSSMVGTQGRGGRFIRNNWWQQKRQDGKKIHEEAEAVRQYEKELMEEALGVRPKKYLLQKGNLNQDQINELFKKEEEEEETVENRKGLGAGGGTIRSLKQLGAALDELPGQEDATLEALKAGFEGKDGSSPELTPPKPEKQSGDEKSGSSSESGSEDEGKKKKLSKSEKKAAKKAKKAAKKAKKLKKQEKKRKKEEKKEKKRVAKEEAISFIKTSRSPSRKRSPSSDRHRRHRTKRERSDSRSRSREQPRRDRRRSSRSPRRRSRSRDRRR